MPRTRSEASREIDRLRSKRPMSRGERGLEQFKDCEVADRWTPATDIRPEEIEGYGSTARWA